MKRIRLQVQILPWQEPETQSAGDAQPRQEQIRPWTQPCADDTTLQQLADDIVVRFGKLHVGKG